MSLPADTIQELKNFVRHAEKHPEVWVNSELSFLTSYLSATFGLHASDFKSVAAAAQQENSASSAPQPAPEPAAPPAGASEEEIKAVEDAKAALAAATEKIPSVEKKVTEELAAEFGSVAPSSTALADECSDLGEEAPEWSEEIDAKAIDAKSAAADAFSNQDFETAARKYTEAIQLQPTAMTIAKRATCFVKLKLGEAALRDADHACSLNPDSGAANKARAKALLLLNRFEDAMHQCQKSNQLDYDDDIYETQKTLEGKFAALTQAKTECEACEKALERAEKMAKQAELRERRAAEEAADKAKAEAEMGGGKGGMPGGKGGGMGGKGGIPPELMAMMADPEIQAMLQKPKVAEAFQDLMTNGMESIGKYQNDPEVMQAMMTIQQKFMAGKGGMGGKGGMAGKGGMGGMGGMPGGFGM